MNTEEVFSLVRSGALFAAISPKGGRTLHNMRRSLLLDCPNTYQEMQVGDEGVARGQSMEDVLTVLLDYVQHPRVEHAQWATGEEAASLCLKDDAWDGVMATTEEDPFYHRGCVLHTVPRKAEFVAGRGLLSLETPEIPRTLKDSACTMLSRVTGLRLNSLALLRRPLSATMRHRCSIQVLSLPSVDQSLLSSPSKAQRPSNGEDHNSSTPTTTTMTKTEGSSPSSPSRRLVEHHSLHKPFVPHCSFGIFCPTEPKDNVSSSLMTLQSHGGTFASRRWLGLAWADGSTVPTLGLLTTVTTTGMVRCTTLSNSPLIRVGDVLTIETRPDDDTIRDGSAGHVLFFVNGKEVARLPMKLYTPTAAKLSDCYFAVRLSEGASVATFFEV